MGGWSNLICLMSWLLRFALRSCGQDQSKNLYVIPSVLEGLTTMMQVNLPLASVTRSRRTVLLLQE